MRPRSLLHDYQLRAIDEIKSRKETMLWLGLGAGKTAIALTAINDLQLPTLVVGTKRIVEMTWPDEIQQWEHTRHLTYRSATGDKKARLKALADYPDVLGINYESLEWLLEEQLAFYKMVIFDEVSKMKAHNTRRYKAFLRKRNQFDRIVGMTATPASESYLGLYAQYRTVITEPCLGRNISHFREQYVTPVFKGMYTDYRVSEKDKQAIEYAIGPHTVVLDTPRRPDPTVHDVGVEWEAAAVEKQYRDAEKKFVVEFENNTHYSMASKSESFTKTRQLATGLFLRDGYAEITSRAKIEAIKEAYEELGGSPVLVFYQFVVEQELLLSELKGAEVLNPASLERFNLGVVPALVVHPRSCGYGLNLQGPCHHVFWSSLPTSGEEYIQSNGRVDRQGQEQQVVIKRFLRERSVDQELAALVEGKIVGMDQLITNMRGRG